MSLFSRLHSCLNRSHTPVLHQPRIWVHRDCIQNNDYIQYFTFKIRNMIGKQLYAAFQQTTTTSLKTLNTQWWSDAWSTPYMLRQAMPLHRLKLTVLRICQIILRNFWRTCVGSVHYPCTSCLVGEYTKVTHLKYELHSTTFSHFDIPENQQC